MKTANIWLTAATAIFAGLAQPSESSAEPFNHKFGEVREYHKHWLRVCPQDTLRGCRAVTYTNTDGFFLTGRLSIERSPQDGSYTLRFLDESETARPEGVQRPVYRFSFTNGEVMDAAVTTNNTYSERFTDDAETVSRLLLLMRRENRMTVSGPGATGVVGSGTPQTYSLIGFSAALDAIESEVRAIEDRAAFIRNLELPGPNWRASEGWPGEYPAGFTVARQHTRMLRAAPKLSASRTIRCTFPTGATYHIWNPNRVRKQDLRFVSMQETSTFRVNVPTSVFYTDQDKRSQSMILRKGDVWKSIRYFAEGLHEAEFEGKAYEAEQNLFQNSTQIAGPDRPQLQQWLGMTCPDGRTGWLNMADTQNDERLNGPNVVEYGKASDLN